MCTCLLNSSLVISVEPLLFSVQCIQQGLMGTTVYWIVSTSLCSMISLLIVSSSYPSCALYVSNSPLILQFVFAHTQLFPDYIHALLHGRDYLLSLNMLFPSVLTPQMYAGTYLCIQSFCSMWTDLTTCVYKYGNSFQDCWFIIYFLMIPRGVIVLKRKYFQQLYFWTRPLLPNLSSEYSKLCRLKTLQ